jgi:FkbM family methyltransferase
VAIEAERANFELLCRNVRHLRNVRPIWAALWSHHTALAITNPEAETWAFRVVEVTGSGAGVPTLTVDDLISMSPSGHIDVLKLDIEGAEYEVFSAAASPCAYDP